MHILSLVTDNNPFLYQLKEENDSSNGCHSGLKIFKPEKNLEFFRLKNFEARDDYPGRFE